MTTYAELIGRLSEEQLEERVKRTKELQHAMDEAGDMILADVRIMPASARKRIAEADPHIGELFKTYLEARAAWASHIEGA